MSRKEKFLMSVVKGTIRVLPPNYSRKIQRFASYTKQQLEDESEMKNVLLLYYSKTGNTRKVISSIQKGLASEDLSVTTLEIHQSVEIDFYDYDLVCIATPVLHASFPPTVDSFIKKYEKQYRLNNEVFISSPSLIGKKALIVVTYAGPHCGVDEALPVGTYLRQFFRHLGFQIVGEWYEVGEFHGWDEGSTNGRLGDIRGRPNREDLKAIEQKTKTLIRSINTQS